MEIPFCKFCKWYNRTNVECNHPKNYADSWLEPEDRLIFLPWEKNNKNNCNWYERKYTG